MGLRRPTDRPCADRLPHLALRRLSAGEKLRATITCNMPQSFFLHYLGGRTLPCVDTGCPGCAQSRRIVRETYLTLWTGKVHGHIILGIPPGAERDLADQAPDYEHARGVIVNIHRIGPKANGRVKLTVEEEMIASSHLPPAPDLIAHLYQIWGLTTDQMGSEHPLFDVRDQLLIPIRDANG